MICVAQMVAIAALLRAVCYKPGWIFRTRSRKLDPKILDSFYMCVPSCRSLSEGVCMNGMPCQCAVIIMTVSGLHSLTQ